MNILFLSQENPYPPDGGHYIRTFNILKLLAERHKIYFIAIANNDMRIQDKSGLTNICETVDLFVVPGGNSKWKIYLSLILNLFSLLPYSVSKNNLKTVRFKIRKIIDTKAIDLVHVDILPLSYYYNEFRNLPKILINHNVESLRLYRWIRIERNPIKKLFLYYQYLKLSHFEKMICPKFDRCVTVSHEDQEALKELCSCDNFIVLPNGVDTKFFKKQKHIRIIENSLIWVGGMGFAYNADAVNYFLDEILPLIKKRIPAIQVSFIGKSPTHKLIKHAEINDHIKVHGFIDDVRTAIQQAAVFIAPIRSGSGTKIKVLNALALEKAVVTTTVGAEGIKVIPGENIFIGDTPQEFARNTIHLLQNPDIAFETGKNGRKVVEKFYSWEIIAKKMYKEYQKVHNNHSTKQNVICEVDPYFSLE